MALFRSERGIGRGEVAESQVEVPFFAAFMMLAALSVLGVHLYGNNLVLTGALAISMLIFGLTVLRVDFGVYILIVGMLLSPEIDAGQVGYGERSLNLRYNDFLIVVIFLGVLLKQAFEGRRILWRPSPVNPAIFSYYLVCSVSFMLAYKMRLPAWDFTASAFVMLKMMEFYMIFFLVGNATTTLTQLYRQLTVFFATGLIVSGYCITQIGSVDRVSAPFEQGGTEPNTLGGYLILVMCLAGGLYVHAPTRRKKLLFIALIASAFTPFLFTLSRASYLALVVCMIVVGVVTRRIGIILLVAGILVLSPVLMPADVLDRVNYTFQRGSGQEVVLAGRDTGLQVDKSTHERIYVWNKVGYNLSIWPWFGGGVGWGAVLDSQYARVLIETGLLGIATFLFLQYRILRTSWQAYVWTGDWIGKGVALGTFVVTIGLIVHSLGTISFLIVRIMEPYWLLVASCVVVRDDAIQEYVRRREALRRESAVGKITFPVPEGTPPDWHPQPTRVTSPAGSAGGRS